MSKETNKKENPFRVLARWFVRWFMGQKYEEKWFLNKDKENEESEAKENIPDDSDLIISPGKQMFNTFIKRKFAVVSVIVVIIMFLIVFIVPNFMDKYSDSYTETTLKNIPPNRTMMSVPKELKNDIREIDSYGAFSVGLSNSGKVYIWGASKIGATDLNVKDIPEAVKNADIAIVAAGVDHVVAFDYDGNFYGWGSNRFGQYAVTDALLENPNIACVPDEVLNGEIEIEHIKKLTCGYQATALLMDDGTLYVWGNKQAYANMDSFIGKTDMEDVDFTLNYIVGLTKDRNSVYTGSRGLYDMARTSLSGTTEKMFTFLNGRKIESLTATSASVCLLLDDGSIALVGDFVADSVDVPSLPDDEKIVDIQAGNYHYTVLTNKGNVYSFGGDHYYQAEAPEGLTGIAKIFTGGFQSYAVDGNGDYVTSWGLKGFWFGTDDVGADILERVVAGGRVTMTFGLVAVIIEVILGVAIGTISGYAGGWVDILLMRIAEVFSSLPLYPFMLIMNSLLAQTAISQNQKLLMMMVVLGVLSWPGFASITRAQILVARESEYVTAAQAMGVKSSRIAFKHILPNVFSVILVNITLSFAASMQTETSLSFLGFGVMYPQPSWGNMLTRASNATAAINFWWQWVFTSVILCFTAVCINTIGDTLRDVMDPKSTNEK